MNTTYARLTSRRAWFVTGVAVWGELAAKTIRAIGTETDDTATRVVYYEFGVGGQIQDVPFASLSDHRGNQLPATIDRPVVIVIPKNAAIVAVIGQPTATGVRLAQTSTTIEDALVDLWIIEAGA